MWRIVRAVVVSEKCSDESLDIPEANYAILIYMNRIADELFFMMWRMLFEKCLFLYIGQI